MSKGGISAARPLCRHRRARRAGAAGGPTVAPAPATAAKPALSRRGGRGDPSPGA